MFEGQWSFYAKTRAASELQKFRRYSTWLCQAFALQCKKRFPEQQGLPLIKQSSKYTLTCLLLIGHHQCRGKNMGLSTVVFHSRSTTKLSCLSKVFPTCKDKVITLESTKNLSSNNIKRGMRKKSIIRDYAFREAIFGNLRRLQQVSSLESEIETPASTLQ